MSRFYDLTKGIVGTSLSQYVFSDCAEGKGCMIVDNKAKCISECAWNGNVAIVNGVDNDPALDIVGSGSSGNAFAVDELETSSNPTGTCFCLSKSRYSKVNPQSACSVDGPPVCSGEKLAICECTPF
jgi:hypothetical protein